MQVAAKDLPKLLEVLQPLIPTESAVPVFTDAFKDGRRIPLLKELLLEVQSLLTKSSLSLKAVDGVAAVLHCIDGTCCFCAGQRRYLPAAGNMGGEPGKQPPALLITLSGRLCSFRLLRTPSEDSMCEV